MKKITIAAVLVFTAGLFFTSCNETKKEVAEENVEVTKEAAETKEHDHEAEMATATYQCPMKCEADKTYPEAGACPVCKMDLKELEVAVETETEKTEMSKEANEEVHAHDENQE